MLLQSTVLYSCVKGGLRTGSSGPLPQGGAGTHPQQVPRDVALLVVQPRPPPLRLAAVLPAQDSDGVALFEGQLVGALGLVVPQGEHATFVHHPQLLLHTWGEERKGGV